MGAGRRASRARGLTRAAEPWHDSSCFASFAGSFGFACTSACDAGTSPDGAGGSGGSAPPSTTTASGTAQQGTGGGFGQTRSTTTGGPASCVRGTGTQGVDCANFGIQVMPPFDADYTCLDLGEDFAIPPKWGGLTTKLGDPDVLLIGGNANQAVAVSCLFSAK